MERIRRIITAAGLVLLLSCSAFAQTYGLKFAYPTTDALRVTGSTSHVTYSIHSLAPKFGLTGELGLPAGLLLELDALYSHPSYRSTAMGTDTLASSTTTINAWDFAVLAKKPFFQKAVRPFVNAGAAFKAVNEDTNVVLTVFPSQVTQSKVRAPEYIHQATAGYAAGLGVDFRIGKFQVTPEFRYTHFQRENFRSPDGSFHSNLNQPMFLLGLQRRR